RLRQGVVAAAPQARRRGRAGLGSRGAPGLGEVRPDQRRAAQAPVSAGAAGGRIPPGEQPALLRNTCRSGGTPKLRCLGKRAGLARSGISFPPPSGKRTPVGAGGGAWPFWRSFSAPQR